MDRPAYTHKPIYNVQSLCKALGLQEPMLRAVAARADRLYIGPMPRPKKNNGVRYVFDTKPPLKQILRTINRVIFCHVDFPPYLTGSLVGRDFVANVDIHKGAKRIVAEDIATFFDHITSSHVYHIWHHFFNFSEEVSELLTRLTTKDGHVFQGTPTSSYLANLAFWDKEPALVMRLKEKGIRYSRYVDDLSMSSPGEMDEETKRWIIAQVYAMVGGAGFKPKRNKHFSATSRGPITIMGLNANSRRYPTLPSKERSAIRAQVLQLEQRVKRGEAGTEIEKDLRRAAGKVGRLKRLHPVEATALKKRLDDLHLG
ncbi:reverse transcriptase family protein [Saezia sanguinis]|uniref:reverse transcriptase family protein n=1 Tax=Saezia sanguinis TaxID=1965230 RepID=UPI0030DCADBF